MPHSDWFGKDWAADIYAVLRPERVLDLGPGAGTWAKVMRPRHSGYWAGCEVWPPYVDEFGLALLYDRVIVADIRHYVRVMPDEWDLWIAGDILEHIPQDEAESLVQRIIDTGSDFLVSVPVIEYHQGALYDNPHEEHLWYPTHEWAMDTLKPASHVRGSVVGAYWVAGNRR